MRRWMIVAALLLCLPMVGEGQSIRYYPPTSSGGDPSSLTSPVIWDDFMTGMNTAGQYGELGWYWVNSAVLAKSGEPNRPGIFGLTGCGAATTCVLFPNVSAYFVQYQNVTSVQWIYRSTTVANQPKRRIGLATHITNDPASDGVYFESLTADANWFCVSRAGAAETRYDTGIAFSSNTWIKFEIRPSASSAACYIDNVLVASPVLTIPAATVTLMPLIHHVGAGTASAFDVDYFRLSLTTTGR